MLEFRVLGAFEALRDGAPVELGGARRRAFLALLVLNAGRVLGAERLIDALWGERPPPTAGHVLHVYVSALRGLLGADALVTRTPGYVLEVPDDAIDLRRFERLTDAARSALRRDAPAAAAAALDEALSLWRGPVLEDLAYEEFVQPEARRLEELHLAARELRAEAGIALNADAGLVATLNVLAQEHPLREPSHALLMRALAATGRQAEALQVFDTLRARLDDELGIEPCQELRALHVAVLRQEIAPSRAPTAPSSAGGSVLAVAFDPARLAAVADVAAAVATGSGRELIAACVLPRNDGDRPDVTTAAGAARRAREAASGPARSAAFASRDPGAAVAALAEEHDVDLVVIDGRPAVAGRARIDGALLAVLGSVTADVALVLGEPPPRGAPLAVPFGGSGHDWAAIELAALIARGRGDGLRLIGVASFDDDGSRLVARAALAVQRAVGLDTDPTLAEPGAASLVEAASGCSGVVLGISDRWHSEGLGELRRAIAATVGCTLVVRRGLRPGLLSPADARSRFTWSIAG